MDSITVQEGKKSDRKMEPWLVAIGSFFMVVLIANIIMIYLGLNSWPGLVTDDHYNKGLAYNEVIAAQEAQDRLGWQAALKVAQPDKDDSIKLLFTLKNRDGLKIIDAEVKGEMQRPLGDGMKRSVILSVNSQGDYVGNIDIAQPGNWDLQIIAKAQQADFRFAERISVYH
ncbi:MAG: FixH family protein [Magnetococcales bacterium]|nr:FixH family protein [Magnetococcales bacterium]